MNSASTRGLRALALAASFLAAAGCSSSSSSSEPESILTDRFVAVPRSPDDGVRSAVQALGDGQGPQLSGETFYIAIRRSELGKRFFLSGYATQYWPDGVFGPSAATFGTRVVTFKVQNDKLFVFDASDITKISEEFDPSLLIEAYPIVQSSRFDGDKNAKQYVLVDPAAGLNRFNFVSELWFGAARFETEAVYLQRFRTLRDGVSWEQVYTGQAHEPIHDGSIEVNPLRASGTIALSIRDYAEGKGFTQIDAPEVEHFFLSVPRLVPDTGSSVQTPVKWNIKPGMKPIKWTISPNVKRTLTDPALAGIDVIGAIEKGVENWNGVFGFTVFDAVVGDDTVSPGDDEVNYIYYDVNPTVGFAYADWRQNPNSGEIRGASVYFNSIFVDIASEIFEDDPAARARVFQRAPFAARPEARLSWNGLAPERLCEYPSLLLRSEGMDRPAHAVEDASLTRQQKAERYITHVVLHEIGHTLGLRHNFKGSLVPTSSSAMEYVDDFEAYLVDQPGPYDVAAVKFLYGLSTALPTQPFCNDDGTLSDPLCARFDVGADPYEELWLPLYQLYTSTFVTDATFPFVLSNAYVNALLGFSRTGVGTGAPRPTQADAVLDVFGVTSGTAAAPAAAIPARFDASANRIVSRLFLDPASARSSFAFTITNDPSLATAPVRNAILSHLQGYLLDTPGVMSFATRRNVVDVLAKVQHLDAYLVLAGARDHYQALLPGISDPGTALLTEDLLRRIERAIDPYFN